MKFASVAGQRVEAKPGLAGVCSGCGQPMVARCGEVNIWHWAHSGRRVCDPWWENETEWHRQWKGRFPKDWQEVFHPGQNQERHFADVVTKLGWVLEFQHSRIDTDERRSRDAIYRKFVWVVDGTRRKRDYSQFMKAIEQVRSVDGVRALPPVFVDECTLLREWSGGGPVFFDFGEDHPLWWLIRRSPKGANLVKEIDRAEFVGRHLCEVAESDSNFDSLLASMQEPSQPVPAPFAPPPQAKPLPQEDEWFLGLSLGRSGRGRL